jgi:hypothetical protein
MTKYYNIPRLTLRKNSGSFQLTRIFSLALISLFVLIATSCEKGVLQIGTDLLPASDFVSISSIDTMSIFSYTNFEPVVESDNPSASYVGQISDPVFGTTTAEFVTQLRLSSKWVSGGHVTVDSVKMVWHILSANGNLNTLHRIKISEISDMLYPDSVYKSNRKPNLTDYSIIDTLPPVSYSDTTMEINLPKEFGYHIFRDPSQLFYDPNHIHFDPGYPDFRSYFKGIYVQMEESANPLLISLYLSKPVSGGTVHASSENYIKLYVRDSLDVASEFNLIFDANAGNAAYNRYEHNFLTATPELRIKHINDHYLDTLSYLQYLNGVYTTLDLPGLEKLKTEGTLGKIAINKARLIVPFHLIDPTKYYAKSAPSKLVLRYKNSDGTKSTVIDYLMGSSNYDPTHLFFDGALDSVNKVYKFNIPQFVQSYLEGTTDIPKPELEIYQGSEIKNVVFAANKNKTPLKFEFTYTKF